MYIITYPDSLNECAYKINPYVPVSGYYKIENGKFIKRNVQTAAEFHYSTKTHDIFTYKKVIKNQRFSGTVTAPEATIDVLKSLLEQDDILFLGGSSSAQYARCKLSFGERQTEKSIKINDVIIAELITNAVVRDEYGMISGNVRNLINAFKNVFDFDGDKTEIYAKTKTGGGFNNLHKLPIQQYTAFARGSVLVFKECTPKSCETVKEEGYFKDITFGGYGQYRLRTVSDINEYEGGDK